MIVIQQDLLFSVHKQQQPKFKKLLNRNWLKEQKIKWFLVEKKQCSLLMILICLEKTDLVLNLPLKLLDNGWIIKDGLMLN